MFVKNNCARLISINDGKKVFDIIPGINAVVEISDAAAGLAFTQNLLESGDLVEVSEPKVEKPVAKRGRPAKVEEEPTPEEQD